MINKRNALKLISKGRLSDQVKRDAMTKIEAIVKDVETIEGYSMLGDARQACLVALVYTGQPIDGLIGEDFETGSNLIDDDTIACQWRTGRPNCQSCGCAG
jgi:hypothetical protein